MSKVIASLGRFGINICRYFGRTGITMFSSLIGKSIKSEQYVLVLIQIYNIGVLSIVIIAISGLFIGIVLGLQGYIILANYGAESSLGTLTALPLLREIGPVITALLFAGRVGSTLTAEIGLMKITEQISSLEMMAVDPLRRIVAPRFWAGVISMPLLTVIFIAISIWGSAIIGIEWKNIDKELFWSAMQNAVYWRQDFITCAIKSILFAIIVTWIALFNGYDAKPTPEGIGLAITHTVVHASLAILGCNFLLTVLMFES